MLRPTPTKPPTPTVTLAIPPLVGSTPTPSSTIVLLAIAAPPLRQRAASEQVAVFAAMTTGPALTLALTMLPKSPVPVGMMPTPMPASVLVPTAAPRPRQRRSVQVAVLIPTTIPPGPLTTAVTILPLPSVGKIPTSASTKGLLPRPIPAERQRRFVQVDVVDGAVEGVVSAGGDGVVVDGVFREVLVTGAVDEPDEPDEVKEPDEPDEVEEIIDAPELRTEPEEVAELEELD